MDWFEASQEIEKLMQEYNAKMDKMVEECDPELKLAVTRWVLNHVANHGKEGGSYRYLIYTRLGFGPEAYAPLLDGGMYISNNFDVEQIENIKAKVREHKIEVLKSDLSLCDEPDCYKEAGCGWPTDEGYRWTCSEHYIHKDKR